MALTDLKNKLIAIENDLHRYYARYPVNKKLLTSRVAHCIKRLNNPLADQANIHALIDYIRHILKGIYLWDMKQFKELKPLIEQLENPKHEFRLTLQKELTLSKDQQEIKEMSPVVNMPH